MLTNPLRKRLEAWFCGPDSPVSMKSFGKQRGDKSLQKSLWVFNLLPASNSKSAVSFRSIIVSFPSVLAFVLPLKSMPKDRSIDLRKSRNVEIPWKSVMSVNVLFNFTCVLSHHLVSSNLLCERGNTLFAWGQKCNHLPPHRILCILPFLP